MVSWMHPPEEGHVRNNCGCVKYKTANVPPPMANTPNVTPNAIHPPAPPPLPLGGTGLGSFIEVGFQPPMATLFPASRSSSKRVDTTRCPVVGCHGTRAPPAANWRFVARSYTAALTDKWVPPFTRLTRATNTCWAPAFKANADTASGNEATLPTCAAAATPAAIHEARPGRACKSAFTEKDVPDNAIILPHHATPGLRTTTTCVPGGNDTF